MDHPLLRKIWTLAQWIFGLAVLVWLGKMIADQWGDIRGVSITFVPGYLAIAIVVLALFYLLYAASWIRILTWLRQEHERWPLLVQARIFFLSILTRYLPAGKALNVGTRIELYHRQGGRRRTAFAAVLIEQLFFMGGAVLLLWLVLQFHARILLPESVAPLHNWILLAGAIIFLGLFFFDRVIRGVATRLHLQAVADAPIQLRWRDKVELLVRFLGVNFLQGLSSYFFLRSVSPLPSTDPAFILLVGAAYPLSRLIGQLVAVVPGGLGVREEIYALLLQAYAPVGVLLVAGGFMRLVSMVLELILVFVLVVATRRSLRSVEAC